MDQKLDSVHDMVEELYRLFTKGLNDPGPTATLDLEDSQFKTPLTFRVFATLLEGGGATLLCPKATFTHKWHHTLANSNGSSIFTCCCTAKNATRSDRAGVHTEDLEFHCTSSPRIAMLS